MEIPILLGANPKTANPSVWVPVRFDRWQVRVEGLIDSELVLHPNFPTSAGEFTNGSLILTLSLNGEVFYGPCRVMTEFKKRGTEKNISVFAVEHK